MTRQRGSVVRLLLSFVVAMLALPSGGCSMGGMRWSSPATQGHGRIGIAPQVVITQNPDRSRPFEPNGFVEYRRGVSPTWDVGARAALVSGAVDTRHLLVRSTRVEAAIGGGVRFGAPSDRLTAPSGSGYELGFEPDARIGINVGRRSQLAFAARPVFVFGRFDLPQNPRRGLSLQPEIVAAFDIGFSDGFHMVPEIAVQTFVGVDSFVINDDTFRLKAALGFYF